VKFGPVPLADAEGAILAHSQRLRDGNLKKGRVLAAEDLRRLAEAGLETVVAARLEPGDVAENEAAAALARAVCGSGVHVRGAFTGRANLYADHDGLLLVDADRLERVNGVHESLTVATLAPWRRVAEREMVATVKIIPFAAPHGGLERACALARDPEPLLEVARFRPRAAGLVQTLLPGTKASVLEKTARVLAARLEALGSRLGAELRCGHSEHEVAEAVARHLAERRDLVLIVGASAIVDRRDVVPAAIVRAGGAIEHFGMPVDPGNLLLLARVGAVPVLGLPGSARSPRRHGLDQVLERLLADVPIGRRDIMALGAGGLLMETAERPQPRAEPPAEGVRPADRARIAAVVLAAGRSRRMGVVNKLLVEVDGVPMVARAVDAALAAGADPVAVVTGHEAARVEAALAGRPVRLAHNPDYAAGLATSLARGLEALPEETQGALVCLGDMPRVTAATLERLMQAFNPLEGRAICVPTVRGKRGNPVLFARRFFPEMRTVRGDVGARHLIGEYAEVVCEVALDDEGVRVDVDSPEALAALEQGSG